MKERVELLGIRSWVAVALHKEGELLGAIAMYRREVRAFTDKQIALLQNFAAQAVIAMENARLITETREALEQQTATAEVLQVINSSPGDLAPVFDTLVETAGRLCGTDIVGLAIRDGDAYRYVAHRALDPAWQAYLSGLSFTPGRGTITGRTLLERRVMHVADLAADPEHTVPELGGLRTFLGVPLLREGEPIGVISLARQRVEPFTDRQIELVRTFADQAVIAMENARLLTETREALEQQTATAEVLQVINSSPGDLAPVFDAILEKAIRLCDADCGQFNSIDGELFTIAAIRGEPRLTEWLRQRGPVRPGPGTTMDKILRGENLLQVVDMKDDEAYQRGDPTRRMLVDVGGYRSMLSIALRKQGRLLGAFSINRKQVRPFTDKQIALLKSFGAQAAIAIENARLLTETRDALEQQTATADVLQVINSSPGDLAPVFDAMLDKAMRLSDSVYGHLLTYDGEFFNRVAVRGNTRMVERQSLRRRAESGITLERIVRGESVVQIADVMDTDAYRSGNRAARVMVDEGDCRTLLTVALRKEDILRGTLSVYHRGVRPFADKQIALLQNFAAQAVIAMENARLLGELRERTGDLEESLEYQTATSDVLKVISRSTFDLQPVLDTLVETAARLCVADNGSIATRDGEIYRVVANFALTPEWNALVRTLSFSPGRDSVTGRTLLERRVVQIADITADPEYKLAGAAAVGKIRTVVGVPLLREGDPIGVMQLGRSHVEPFTERQIELVRTFADQAVIAIENTRLITETREALEQQTATAEILEVINRSPGDLTPVFDAILDKAHTLCGATRGTLFLFDGLTFRGAAVHGYPEELAERMRQGVSVSQAAAFAPLLTGARLIHFPDLMQVDDPMARFVAERGGARTNLLLPLRKDGTLLGVISCNREEVRPYRDQEIALLESFGAQAVIAMDNARLLNEIRRRQAELRVTFDNMGDGVAMFDGELRLVAWNLNFQRILDLPDAFLTERPSYSDYIRFLAERGEFGTEGIAPELIARLEATDQELRLERARPDGSIIEVRRNAVPGGGFVTIYSEITERKRAEEEIRAARDTAERALQELKTTQASLLHAQKMAALGQLTAGIAHEIKNPLNFVNNFAGLSVELLDELKETVTPAMAALDENKRAEVDEVVGMLTGNLEKIAEHGKRADGIVTSMLAHSRGSSGERQSVDINALVEEALNLAYHGARAQDQNFNITLERELDRNMAPIELVPQEVTRVFLNLFGNGFYAATKRSREAAEAGYRPVLKVATRDLGEAVEIRVRDNGTGIAPEQRDKLFQPFFTTKPTGEGTGLGLSISYDIVTQQHGGAIEVDSRVGEFTEFVIRLPRTRPGV